MRQQATVRHKVELVPQMEQWLGEFESGKRTGDEQLKRQAEAASSKSRKLLQAFDIKGKAGEPARTAPSPAQPYPPSRASQPSQPAQPDLQAEPDQQAEPCPGGSGLSR